MEAATSISVAEADRIEREQDWALRALHRAGGRGVLFAEQVSGPGGTSRRLPLGPRFVSTLEALAGFGLVEFGTPDRTYLAAGMKVSHRATLTALGIEKAAALATTEEVHEN